MLQPCTVLATECWHDMLVRIVQCGVALGGCFCAMDVATKCVKLGFPGSTQASVDVDCICGLCSTQLPRVRHWIPINWDVVVSWPVLGLGSLRTFSSRKDRGHKKKQPRPAVVEAACSDNGPPDTCEGLPARRVIPVRQCRLAQPVVLEPGLSELDAQSSSFDSSDIQSESSGSSGSESSQSSCSSSSDSDTQKAEPRSPPVPKPNPKSVAVPGTLDVTRPPPCPKPNPTSGTLGATRGPQAPPCPKPASMPGPISGDPPAISCHQMVDVLLQSSGDSSYAAPIERTKKFRRSADASKPKPKLKPKPSQEYIYSD